MLTIITSIGYSLRVGELAKACSIVMCVLDMEVLRIQNVTKKTNCPK